jgi:hypothetical protein
VSGYYRSLRFVCLPVFYFEATKGCSSTFSSSGCCSSSSASASLSILLLKSLLYSYSEIKSHILWYSVVYYLNRFLMNFLTAISLSKYGLTRLLFLLFILTMSGVCQSSSPWDSSLRLTYRL